MDNPTNYKVVVILMMKLLLIASISLSNFPQTHANQYPKSLVLSISKNPKSHQYLTTLGMGTPMVEKSLVVDLRGSQLWMDCDHYRSSTYKPSPCGSASCTLARSAGCHSNNNTCYVMSKGNSHLVGEVSTDTIGLIRQRPSGQKVVTIPDYIFSCGKKGYFSNNVQGMLGLGGDQVGFPTQVASAFGGRFTRKFAICLPANSTADGVMLMGDYSYTFHSTYIANTTNDISYRVAHTKLYLKGDDDHDRNKLKSSSSSSPNEYFVKVTSIYVNDKQLPTNSTSSLGLDAKISTTTPYTILETSIYKNLIKVFDEEIISGQKVKKVAPVAPFRDCYTKGFMEVSSIGLSTPQITFVFESKKVYWPIYGANTVVEVSRDVVCLGFMDGGPAAATTTPIVIGALQMENNLVEFDLAKSRMGFTSSLILGEVECSTYKL